MGVQVIQSNAAGIRTVRNWEGSGNAAEITRLHLAVEMSQQ